MAGYSPLHALPHRAAGHVSHLNALLLQLVADTVSLGKVLGLLGLTSGQDQSVDGSIALAGHSVASGGLSGLGLGLLLAELGRLVQQREGQHLVKAVQNGPLGGPVGLGLQGIIEGGHTHGGVQVIAHLLGEIDDLENKNRAKIIDIILMVQEEVARRIVATENSAAKQYGLLTILSQFWADCSIIRLVGRKSFYPAPKVNSALVSLKVRKEPLLKLDDYKHFRKTIKAAFSQRRKTLKNCLSGAGFDRDKVSKVIQELGLDENIRGEKLSIAQLGELSEKLCD